MTKRQLVDFLDGDGELRRLLGRSPAFAADPERRRQMLLDRWDAAWG